MLELLVPGPLPVAARDYAQPASVIGENAGPEHVVAIHLRGGAPVEQRLDGRWRRAVLSPGRLTVLPAFRPSSWRLHGEVGFFHLAFPQAAVEELARAEGLAGAGRPATPDAPFGAHDPLIARLALAVRDQLLQPRALSGLFVETALRLVLVHLLQRHRAAGLATPPGPHGLVGRPGLRRAVDLVEARLGGDLGLAELAGEAGLTPVAFGKAFKRALGVSPYHYVLRRRVEVAKCMLRDTDLPVIEVAARVGFENPQHFAKVFRRFAGASPRAFRRSA